MVCGVERGELGEQRAVVLGERVKVKSINDIVGDLEGPVSTDDSFFVLLIFRIISQKPTYAVNAATTARTVGLERKLNTMVKLSLGNCTHLIAIV